MHIYRKFWFNFFFLGIAPFVNLEIWPKWKILLKQYVRATPLILLNRITWNFVVMKDLICWCAYLQEILIQFFFLGVMPLLNLEIWPKWKILLKTVRQPNSTGTAQQNFLKLCSYEEHNVKICIFTGKSGARGMRACSLFLSLLPVIRITNCR